MSVKVVKCVKIVRGRIARIDIPHPLQFTIAWRHFNVFLCEITPAKAHSWRHNRFTGSTRTVIRDRCSRPLSLQPIHYETRSRHGEHSTTAAARSTTNEISCFGWRHQRRWRRSWRKRTRWCRQQERRYYESFDADSRILLLFWKVEQIVCV